MWRGGEVCLGEPRAATMHGNGAVRRNALVVIGRVCGDSNAEVNAVCKERSEIRTIAVSPALATSGQR